MPGILSDIASVVEGVNCLVVASRYSGFIGYGLLWVYFVNNIFKVCDDVPIVMYPAGYIMTYGVDLMLTLRGRFDMILVGRYDDGPVGQIWWWRCGADLTMIRTLTIYSDG